MAAAMLLLASALSPQVPDTATRAAGAASVRGVVFDSLAGHPLAGAVVQLVDADSLSGAARSQTSDSLGRFGFDALRAGRYLLTSFHPTLDSLGLELPPRLITVGDADAVRADLAIPAPRTVRTTICGTEGADDGDALIIGFVRNAQDRQAIETASVMVRWVELTLDRGRLERTISRREALTPESGWFAMCGAPSGGTVVLSARRGADSTVALELEVPKTGFLRRDLYIGSERVASAGADAGSDSTLIEVRLTGDGRLTGTVVAQQGGRPLAGARVGIANGPQTRADAQGAWTLTSIPTGTRTLEVRAIAHLPVNMPVDVFDGAAPVHVAMLTMQSVLDTVRITARRLGSNRLIDFLARKRSSGAGRFLTSDDIASRRPLYASDLLRTIPGMLTQRDQTGGSVVTMRGGFNGRCRPVVYVNGFAMTSMSNDDIDGMVRPEELIGVEVYSATTAPAQYGDWNGCGSILFWTR